MTQNQMKEIAQKICSSKVILITSGAGIGVDSGLPDFRGNEGFWNAYPMYERLGLSFMEAANPVHFSRDPNFGWGFYGHRLNLYRSTTPNRGFDLLKKWTAHFSQDLFIITSNVDGQFQKAGFDSNSIYEVHGSIHHLQCTRPCTTQIWANNEEIVIDQSVMRAQNLPRCPHCGSVARPNILMFGDYSWLAQRSDSQEERLNQFLETWHGVQTVVIEIGAGTSVPTIRYWSESLGRRPKTTTIRINPREPTIAPPHFSVPKPGLKALEEIDRLLML